MTKEQRKAYNRAYYLANPEKIRSYQEAHKEKKKAYHKTYYSKNKEKMNIQIRDAKLRNKLHNKSRNAAYCLAHSEEIKAKKKAYRLANKEKIRAYLLANVDRTRENGRRYRKNNIDRKRERNRKRDAIKLGNKHEPYTDIYIFERDNWVCGICGQKINKKLKYPNPRSKSIDHILAISKGGADAPINVQAAHLRCNVGKNANNGGQLRLIG